MCAGLLPGTDPCLVSPSSCNRISQAEGLKQLVSLIVPEAGSPKSGWQQHSFTEIRLGPFSGEHMGPTSYPYSSIFMTSCMHGQLPKTLSPNTIISRAVVSIFTFWGIHACTWVPHSSFCTLKFHGFTCPSLMLQPSKYSKTATVSPGWIWLIHLYRFSMCSLQTGLC